jgi:serine/threonine-protein kinase
MTTDTANWVGQTLSGDRYQVTAMLGEGGMGLVYCALDRRLDTEVVIKVPRPAMLEEPAFVGRFAREIRSLVQLVHPHIVKVMDVGEHGGVPFAVLQYLPGGSLRDRQRKGSGGEPLPPSPEDLRTWLEPVAEALDFIHRKGYVHRDVKPDNILFDAEGHAYLSDFGVAKVLAQQGGRKKNTALTGAGMILGTPHFMAAELILGQPFDGRADQYALGVAVYELLAGRYPFDGATPVAIYLQHTTEEPVPLESALPGVPKGLASAVRKALAKEPGERYPDCASFARAALAALDAAVAPQQAPAAGTAVTLVCPGCRKPFARPVRAERVRCPSCGKALQVSRNRHRPSPTGRAGKPGAGTGTVAASGPPPASMQGKAHQAPKTTPHGSPPPVAKLVPPAQEIISTHGQSRPKRRPAARRLWPWLVMGVTGCLLTGVLLSGLHLTGKPPVVVEAARKQDRRERSVTKATTTGEERKPSPPTETTGTPEETPAEVVARPSSVTPPAAAEPQLPVAEPTTLPPPTPGADGASPPTEKAGKPGQPAEKTQPDKEAWVQLFNGHDLQGWKGVPDGTGNWRVEDGLLVVHGQGPNEKEGWLLTEELFGDFKLRLKFMLTSGAASAVTFRADPADWRRDGKLHCIRGFKIMDDSNRRPKSEQTGWFTGSGVVPVKRHAELLPVGSWNQLELEVRGPKLKLMVNGKEVQGLDLASTPGTCGWPAFQRSSGRIGLQSQFGVVKYRDIEVARGSALDSVSTRKKSTLAITVAAGALGDERDNVGEERETPRDDQETPDQPTAIRFFEQTPEREN